MEKDYHHEKIKVGKSLLKVRCVKAVTEDIIDIWRHDFVLRTVHGKEFEGEAKCD